MNADSLTISDLVATLGNSAGDGRSRQIRRGWIRIARDRASAFLARLGERAMLIRRYAGPYTGRGMGSTSSMISATGGTAASALTTALPLIYGSMAAVPVVGWIAAGALALTTSLMGAFGVGDGCGQSCITASNDANAIEPAMRANLAAYQNGQISQSEAQANYNTLWAQLVAGCEQVGGSAGANCISDRQQGACKWKDANDQCWNWYLAYFSPLQQPPTNAPAVSAVSGFTVPQLLGLALLGVVALEVL